MHQGIRGTRFAAWTPIRWMTRLQKNIKRGIPLAQLIEELFSLTDAELQELGIARSQIHSYAESKLRVDE